MAEFVLDIFEQILVRMDVRDLIRCKSVCKSWKSLISDPRFIKSQLNHSYNKHHNYNEIGHRRVTVSLLPDGFTSFKGARFCHLLGSSNGLVCIYTSNVEIIVANPCTRAVIKLPDRSKYRSGTCFGFGYDKSTDEYKVVVGFPKGEDRTCFQVLNLKTNVWKVIGEVKYKFFSRVGILCSGALHWVMHHVSPSQPSQRTKTVILSFDLSQEDFKEISQPDDALYQSVGTNGLDVSLGIIEECLCIFPHVLLPHKIWMMKKYNVNPSWGILEGSHERELNCEVLRFFRQLKNGIPFERSSDSSILFFRTREFLCAPIFVQSLVSPHDYPREIRL